MIQNIDHIGIAVHSIEDALPFYTKGLRLTPSTIELVESQGVKTIFFNVGGTHIELLEPVGPEGAIAKFLQSHGPGVHHIALRSSDINGEIDTLRGSNCRLIYDTPQPGAHSTLMTFIHPKSAGGVLFEVVEHGKEL
jgi:methylmalonyl-CoA/ethylmalonyl-CoA epimerase